MRVVRRTEEKEELEYRTQTLKLKKETEENRAGTRNTSESK